MKKTKKRNFQPNLIYVFSYKKLKKSCRYSKITAPKWTKELNGRLVTLRAIDKTGIILGTGYSINANWCKCIGRKLKNEKRNRPSHYRPKASRTKFPVCK